MMTCGKSGSTHIPNKPTAECIRVQKVYDWVTATLPVEKTIIFTNEQIAAIEKAMDDPRRRPLRIVCKSKEVGKHHRLGHADESDDMYDHDHNGQSFCEQVGEKRNIKVVVGGQLVDAQLVQLLFKSDLKIQVVDRHNHVVTEAKCDVTLFESFVLCFPDGTELFCKITKVVCKIPTGTVLLNCPVTRSFTVNVMFCVDIQVEAEVKLEVMAKFCTPRENDITPPTDADEQCPKPAFPPQCPTIFPRKSCDNRIIGDGMGIVLGYGGEEEGRAELLVDIGQDGNFKNSQLQFRYQDHEMSEDRQSFTFHATTFDQSSAVFKKDQHGTQFKISGTGKLDNGKVLNFTVAINDADEFEVELTGQNQQPFFHTGVVQTIEGKFTIEDHMSMNETEFVTAP